MTLCAIVLSGGTSSRMGTPKALLALGAETFLRRLARTLRNAELDRIVVITGVHDELIRREVASWNDSQGVRLLRNDDPAADQLSSLRCGLTAAEAVPADGALVALIDQPLVTAETVRALVHRWRAARAPVVRPVSSGRHGHPVIFDRATFGDLCAPGTASAKDVVRRRASPEGDVEVSDPGIWIDIDTPEEYARVLGSGQWTVGSGQ